MTLAPNTWRSSVLEMDGYRNFTKVERDEENNENNRERERESEHKEKR